MQQFIGLKSAEILILIFRLEIYGADDAIVL